MVTELKRPSKLETAIRHYPEHNEDGKSTHSPFQNEYVSRHLGPPQSMGQVGRIVVVSNRLPVILQLGRNAVQVNPYNTDGVARAIRKAFLMGADERKSRMRKLRNLIRRRDVHWWANLFFQTTGWSDGCNRELGDS